MDTLIDTEHLERMALAGAQVKAHPKHNPVVLVPKDYTMEELQETPLREEIDQRVTLDDLASFIAYVNTFKEEPSRIFATVTDKGAEFAALLDYHYAPYRVAKEGRPEPGVELLETDGPGARNWNLHRADFKPAYASEFAAWLGVNKKPLSQEAFIEHLRRWGYLVTNHDAATLAEYVANLEFRTNGTFKNKLERVKGGRALVWLETVEAGSTARGVEVPIIEQLSLYLPLFVNGKEYPIQCDLTYKVGDGSLEITPELIREHLPIREAVRDMVEEVAVETHIRPFLGKPV